MKIEDQLSGGTEKIELITKTAEQHYPDVQAIYLFGSYGTANAWPQSDVDIALLLPHRAYDNIKTLYGTQLHTQLEILLSKTVDLIHLRLASTVFRKEVISTGRRIFCADTYAADEFEMLTLSLYQKLNEEREDILNEALKNGRFLDL